MYSGYSVSFYVAGWQECKYGFGVRFQANREKKVLISDVLLLINTHNNIILEVLGGNTEYNSGQTPTTFSL